MVELALFSLQDLHLYTLLPRCYCYQSNYHQSSKSKEFTLGSTRSIILIQYNLGITFRFRSLIDTNLCLLRYHWWVQGFRIPLHHSDDCGMNWKFCLNAATLGNCTFEPNPWFHSPWSELGFKSIPFQLTRPLYYADFS